MMNSMERVYTHTGMIDSTATGKRRMKLWKTESGNFWVDEDHYKYSVKHGQSHGTEYRSLNLKSVKEIK